MNISKLMKTWLCPNVKMFERNLYLNCRPTHQYSYSVQTPLSLYLLKKVAFYKRAAEDPLNRTLILHNKPHVKNEKNDNTKNGRVLTIDEP